MPVLIVKLSGKHAQDVSSRIAGTLTNLTVTILKKKRELTAISVEYIPSDDWFVGGESTADLSLTTFYLEVTVTDGTNTKDEKARFISQAFSAMEALLGPVAQASYIVVRDVRGEAWGYQGKTQEYRYVSGTLALQAPPGSGNEL